MRPSRRPSVERLVRGGDDRGVRAQAEIVVGGERHDRRHPRAAPGGPEGVELPRRTPAALLDHLWRAEARIRGRPSGVPVMRRRPRSRWRPVADRPSTGGHVVERPIERVDHADDLVLGDGQRRHEHHDVAERPQQHAPGDGAGARPGGPSAVPARAEPARHRPSARAGGPRAPPARPATRSSRRRRQLLGAGAHVGQHVPRLDEAQVLERHRGGRARSRRRSARGRRSAARGRHRGTRRTPRPTPPWPTWRGSRR